MTSVQSSTRLPCGNRVLDLAHTHVMGILNVTPDSFSDGGRFAPLAAAARQQQDGAFKLAHEELRATRQKKGCDITPGCFSYNWTSSMKAKVDAPFVPLNIAVLTVSDTRTLETDTSGQVFVDRLRDAGHTLAARVLLKDDLYKIRAQVATWIADDRVQVVLITGGTGFTARSKCQYPLRISGGTVRQSHQPVYPAGNLQPLAYCRVR